MEPEVVIASSSIDAGIGCWDLELETGIKQRRHYKSCASTPHGLAAVGSRFLASSQLRDAKASTGYIHYWSWSKLEVEVKSFVDEPIKPLAANSEGTYLVGGGISGNMYVWAVATGRLLKKWRAHNRTITCLVFNDDDSLLVSGSEDGSVRVWSLLMMFDDQQPDYLHSFAEHTLPVTDLVIGHGGWNAVIVSASKDRTCKVWSLSKGELLRTVVFPCEINALALDPGEAVFYAGGKDGKIYLAALSASSSSKKTPWLHIIDSLSTGSKNSNEAVTSLAYSNSKNLLLAGSEDGLIRVWNPKMHNLVSTINREKGEKGPVNNLWVIRRPLYLTPGRKSSLPPQLQRSKDSKDDDPLTHAVIALQHTNNNPLEAAYGTPQMINDQLKELQQKGSSAAAEMEVEKLKHDLLESKEMTKRLKRTYDSLHEFCVDELLEGDRPPKN